MGKIVQFTRIPSLNQLIKLNNNCIDRIKLEIRYGQQIIANGEYCKLTILSEQRLLFYETK